MVAGSSTQTLPAGNDAGRGVRVGYSPALDGLRAFAVIAVIFYHADMTWIPGGFLGVEIFFVISGYLITSLLLAEWNLRGQINLKEFWLRRARRLLPALFVLLLTVLTFAVLFLPEEVAELRSDALAATGYVTNWYLIFSHKSYFEAVGRPSLLRHLWSLAVEEQFYLLWPLLFTGLMLWLKPRRALFAILAGIIASTLLMVALYDPTVDPSRVYYGTDTRAAGLLLGAALAYVWAPLQNHWPKIPDWAFDVAGFGSLFGLLLTTLITTEFSPFLYRGGFLVVGLLTVGLIAASVHPRAKLLSRTLSLQPFVWVGLRSYGIYLWHWPVCMVTRPELDVPLTGVPLLILRLALTMILAELSYRFVEMPIRKGALGRAWHNLHNADGEQRRQLNLRWAGAGVAVLIFTVALGQSVVSAQPPPPPAYLAVKSIDTGVIASHPAPQPAKVITDTAPISVTVATPPPAPKLLSAWARPFTWLAVLQAGVSNLPGTSVARLAQATPQASSGSAVSAGAAPTATGAISATKPSTPLVIVDQQEIDAQREARRHPAATATITPTDHVTLIGDSVMLGAANYGTLQSSIEKVEIDAAQGRQAERLGNGAPGALEDLQTRKAAGTLGKTVVIHIGNNGTIDANQFDKIMAVLADAKRVIWLNIKVPPVAGRAWQNPNNAVLTEGVKRYPNAVLIDWLGFSSKHPEFFWGDGIHLRPEGAQAYANLIVEALKASDAGK
jgi:peptidoglycan/LPS O-acetylase OafA/YrhL